MTPDLPTNGKKDQSLLEGHYSWNKAPFEVFSPTVQNIPFVFNSPHSGRYYPLDFIEKSRLNNLEIRRSEDHFVDQLFKSVIKYGAPLMVANYPRAFVDVNREPFELDPKMFSQRLPAYANSRSLRVSGGLGTIPKIVAENMNIYKHRINLEEGLARIENIYRPYHNMLKDLIVATHVKFGHCVLIDCHSMPASANFGKSSIKPDFIIGNCFGKSASSALSQYAIDILRNLGYKVSENTPYAGGFITQHYGRPQRNLHAIQIEINRGLYVNEKTVRPKPEFDTLKDDLEKFVKAISLFDAHDLSNDALAAE